jgi:NADPH:quinone reductase-like Zn-dependent oxidoreductase
MKAIVYTKYGPPDVLQLKEVEKPTPRDNEALVKVHAASLNAADLDYLRGRWMVRFAGPLKPMYKILGSDIAGRVEAVGRNVKQFHPGDEIFVDLFVSGFGAFAEYVCVPETALMGAGGGAGTFAVQLAKYFGAEVTGVDSTGKLDMLRSIGADHVIDYTQEDFTKSGQRYDLILDVVVHRSIFDYKRALSPGGICAMVGGSMARVFLSMLLGPLILMMGRKKMGIVMWKPNKKEDLDFLKELFEAGKVVPVIDRRYPLSEVPEALRYLEEGHALGKVVITVEHNNKT